MQQVADGLYAIGSNCTSNKIAGFDLDWTLIRPVRGKFPKDSNDWAMLPNRLKQLKLYQDAGYCIAIFSNQGYKGKNLTKAIDRVNNVIRYLYENGINPWVLVATKTGDDIFRKPQIGMWQTLERSVMIDKNNSFFCGDAAGRSGDFSDSDIQFARNYGINFYTPEEIFTNEEVIIPNSQTMFIFVGMPGSGKTTYYNNILKPRGWVHINQDELKTKAKVISTLKNALREGKSVAIDGTNPGVDKRREYLNIAIEYQVPTMILYFVGNGHERNKLRNVPVPNVAYNMYYKHLVEPTYETDGVPVVQLM